MKMSVRLQKSSGFLSTSPRPWETNRHQNSAALPLLCPRLVDVYIQKRTGIHTGFIPPKRREKKPTEFSRKTWTPSTLRMFTQGLLIA